MFRFADPQYLYFLPVVLLLALIRWLTYRNQKKRLRKFGDPSLVKELMPDVSYWRPTVKFWLLEAALALLLVMLARPQFGKSISQEKRAGIETIIAIDVSNSMRAVDKDIDTSLSRMDRAKMLVGKLIDKLDDDKVGIIVFAGDAFVLLPITNDYVSAKMFLNDIDPSMIRNQGTNLAEALEMANISFTQNEHVGKAIIVITDGEDHEGSAIEAAKDAHDNGRTVYVLGIGSTRGTLVPDPSSGHFMIDNTGNEVMSKLNEQMCKDVALAGGGAYIRIDNVSSALSKLNGSLNKMEKSESVQYNEYDEQFQAVGIIILVLIILEICILDRKSHRLRSYKLFKK